jgi:alanine racemase
VVIWDNENITLQELADTYDTITYEILSTVGERVPRKFV